MVFFFFFLVFNVCTYSCTSCFVLFVHRIRKRCVQCLKNGKKEIKTQFCCPQCGDVSLCMQDDLKNSCWTQWHKQVHQGMAQKKDKKQNLWRFRCVPVSLFEKLFVDNMQIICSLPFFFACTVDYSIVAYDTGSMYFWPCFGPAQLNTLRKDCTGMHRISACVEYSIQSIGDFES